MAGPWKLVEPPGKPGIALTESTKKGHLEWHAVPWDFLEVRNPGLSLGGNRITKAGPLSSLPQWIGHSAQLVFPSNEGLRESGPKRRAM